jgi:hypothetical protein
MILNGYAARGVVGSEISLQLPMCLWKKGPIDAEFERRWRFSRD